MLGSPNRRVVEKSTAISAKNGLLIKNSKKMRLKLRTILSQNQRMRQYLKQKTKQELKEGSGRTRS
jgi:hypothetical protein